MQTLLRRLQSTREKYWKYAIDESDTWVQKFLHGGKCFSSWRDVEQLAAFLTKKKEKKKKKKTEKLKPQKNIKKRSTQKKKP